MQTYQGLITLNGSVISNISYPVGDVYRSPGVKIGNYRYKISQGLPATTPLTGSRISADFVPWNAVGSYEKYPTTLHTLNGIPKIDGTEVYPSFPSSPDSLASTQLYANIASVASAFQTGTFFGELRETIHMLRSPFKSLTKSLADYGRLAKYTRNRIGYKTPIQKKAVSKALASTWLEYVYGWSPLLGDIDGIFKALHRRIENKPRYRVIGSASDTAIKPSVLRSGYINTPFIEYVDTSATSIVRYTGSVSAHNINNLTIPGTEQLGLSMRDFLPTVWELIPYSFLVDYFSNAGDFITALSYYDVKLDWCNRTELSVKSCSIRGDFDAARVSRYNSDTFNTHRYGWYKASGSTGHHTRTETSFNRAQSVPAVPGFTLKLPVSAKQIVNIGALAFLKTINR